MRLWLSIVILLTCLAACETKNKTELEPPPRLDPLANPNWTEEERADYEKCLEQSIAVAMAWEVIQQQCRDRVNRGGPTLDLK